MGVSLRSKHSKNYDMGYITFNRLRTYIAENIPHPPSNGTVSFLIQSDAEGKLSYKECRELLNDIKGLEDKGVYYGYTGLGAEHCLTITKFKSLLLKCIASGCILKWN